MSKAAFLGMPLLALGPVAHAVVSPYLGGSGTWTGSDPGASSTIVKKAKLTGFGSGLLVLEAMGFSGDWLHLRQYASGLSGGASFGLTGSGAALPPVASQWPVDLSRWGSLSFSWSTGSPSAYLGYQVTSLLGTSHYWVVVSPTLDGLVISGYGSFAASASVGSGGASGGPGGVQGTPEPAASGLALLALGAAGIIRHRRRRQVVA